MERRTAPATLEIEPASSPFRPSMAEPYVPFIVETLTSYPGLCASRVFEMVRKRGGWLTVLFLGQMVTNSVCPRCGGQGQVITDKCNDCGGEGRRVEERTYTVDIPPGVDTGSTLRLTGRGAAGPRGGANGDLYVHVRVAPSDRFTRDGVDLRCDLPVSFAQAALGAQVDFETLDGTEELVVQRGTASGTELRLRGKGVPHLERRARGDLIVRIVVDVPTDLSPEQEELLRQYAAQRGEDVADADAGFLSKIRSAFR